MTNIQVPPPAPYLRRTHACGACIYNPPRPCASRLVKAFTEFQTLQTSQNLQTKLLGGGFTLPLPPPNRSGSLRCSFGWHRRAHLGQAKSFAKVCISCLRAFLELTMPPSIPQLHASYLPFDVYMPKVAPKSPHSHFHASKKIPKWISNWPTINPKTTQITPPSDPQLTLNGSQTDPI